MFCRQWKWSCSRSLEWVSFLPDVGAKLEKAFVEGKDEETICLGGGVSRIIDFKRMVCVNTTAKRCIDVRRAESEGMKRREDMRIAKRVCAATVPIAHSASVGALASAAVAAAAAHSAYRRRCMFSAGIKWTLVLLRVRKKIKAKLMLTMQQRVEELMAESCPRVTVDLVKGVVNMTENLAFEGGKAILAQESRSLMDEINFAMGCIKQTVGEFQIPFLHFWIEGHTSFAKKSKDGGLATSTSRAAAVAQEMVISGIDGDNLHSRGWGDKKPLGGNKDDDRRVEIKVIPENQVASLSPQSA
jgi:outer membrane protein OmpA-like peptidoglycan-associated protein